MRNLVSDMNDEAEMLLSMMFLPQHQSHVSPLCRQWIQVVLYQNLGLGWSVLACRSAAGTPLVLTTFQLPTL